MMKILVVDDDAFIVEAYSRKLRQSGFEVESAGDGLAAKKLLPQMKPEIVVLDLMLPQMNGFELLKYVRAQAELKGNTRSRALELLPR
jgi:DNA-binding response OmpR family regulator